VAIKNVKIKETETLSKCKDLEIRGQQGVKIGDKFLPVLNRALGKFKTGSDQKLQLFSDHPLV
jgi:hypothetical protein